jgi:hypothetical protein
MKYKDIEEKWSYYWFQFILNQPDKDWDWIYGISENPNMTREILESNIIKR